MQPGRIIGWSAFLRGPLGDAVALALAPGVEALGQGRSCSASTAAASSAALTAPARPMASVPTGMPAGICTMESRLSWPDRALDSTGTPKTGSGVMAAVMPGRWAAPPAPAMITWKPSALAPLAKAYEPVRGAVGRDDAGIVGDAERVERLGGVAHGRPVGLAAHDDGNGDSCHGVAPA